MSFCAILNSSQLSFSTKIALLLSKKKRLELLEQKRRTGPLLRTSGSLNRLYIKPITELHREVRILIDHVETLYELKKEFKNVDEFMAVDIDYKKIINARHGSKLLDKKENRKLKKTKRALIQTVSSYKRMAESVDVTVSAFMYDDNLSPDNQEQRRWCFTFLADLRNRGSHCYRCPCENGHEEFDSREYWEELWRELEGVLETIQDLEKCLYRTKLALRNEVVTVTALEPRQVLSTPRQGVEDHNDIAPLPPWYKRYTPRFSVDPAAKAINQFGKWLVKHTETEQTSNPQIGINQWPEGDAQWEISEAAGNSEEEPPSELGSDGSGYDDHVCKFFCDICNKEIDISEQRSKEISNPSTADISPRDSGDYRSIEPATPPSPINLGTSISNESPLDIRVSTPASILLYSGEHRSSDTDPLRRLDTMANNRLERED